MTGTAVVKATVTAVQVAQGISASPYRTVRFGTVSIREVKPAPGIVKYSVRAPVTAHRASPGGRYVTGRRETVIYDDQSEVAAVVNAQHHIRRSLPPRAPRAISTGRRTRALRGY